MWSKGFVAEAIDQFCRTQEMMDSSGERHRGVLTADDMARFVPRVEAPVTYEYGRYTVCKGGFWSQGPAMLQQLALLKGFNLDGADPTSADFIHTLVECSKLAYADRDTFYGDPDFVKVPGEMLLSDAYNDARRKLVGEEASLEQRPGNIPGYGMRLDVRVPGGKRIAAPGAGEPTVGKQAWTHDDTVDPSLVALDGGKLERTGVMRGDTVHFDIIDRDGNMVSSTPSGGWLQSSPTIPELGFCLGTRAQQFWLDEGHPNAIAPGKRPRTTLTPTMALRDGEPLSRLGLARRRPAGPVDRAVLPAPCPCGMNLQEAIDAPAWHSEHFASLVLAARGAPRRAGGRRAGCRPTRSRNCAAAAMSSRSGRTGRKAASRPPRATADAARPPPIRAACRATPPGGRCCLSRSRSPRFSRWRGYGVRPLADTAMRSTPPSTG